MPPFGFDNEYPNFDACVADNRDKSNPEAFCGWLKRETEGKSVKTFFVSKLALAEINPRQLREVDNTELVSTHRRTHQWFENARRAGDVIEDIVHAHDWAAEELVRRDLNHDTPLPVRGPRPASDVQKWAVHKVIKANGHMVLVPEYISLVGSALNRSLEEAHDLDFVVRDEEDVPNSWMENIFLILRKIFDPDKKLGKDIHLIFNPQGPHEGKYLPLFDLVIKPSEQGPRLVKSASEMPAWRAWMKQAPEGLYVDLGPGDSRPLGFLGVGKGDQAQLQTDLEKTPWPIESDSLSIVRANHVLEHLSNPTEVMLEIHRVLRPGGIAIITVPSTKGEGAFAHPEHKTFWNKSSFYFWTDTDLAATVDGQTNPPSIFVMEHMAERGQGVAQYVDVVLRKPANITKSHSRAKCMECSASPTTEIRWAEGMAHAWFCDKHLESWRANKDGWHDIDAERNLRYGLASQRWSDGPPTRKEAEEYLRTHKLVSQLAQKRALAPIARFQAPHPAQRGRGGTDAFRVDEAWKWIEPRLENGVTMEPKLNGFRSIVQGDGSNISIRFEGGAEEAPKLLRVQPDLGKLEDLPPFIIDCDIAIKQGDTRWSRPRLQTLTATKPELPDGAKIVLTAFDLLYWDDQSFNELPFLERRKGLEASASRLRRTGIDITPSRKVTTKDSVVQALKSNQFGSASMVEGLVFKDNTWEYEPGPSTSGMFKIKHTLEVKARVLEVKVAANQKRAYRGGLVPGDMESDLPPSLIEQANKRWVDMGFSFNSDLRAKEGDTVTFSVDEIIWDEKNGKLAWLGAVPLDVDRTRGPYRARQTIDLAERAGVLQQTPKTATKAVLTLPDFPAGSLTIERPRKKPKDLPPFLRVEPTRRIALTTKQSELRAPNGKTVSEILRQAPWDPEDIKFRDDREAYATGEVCGSCRFYLRDPRRVIGRCQIMSPDVDVPWWWTSDAYINAAEDAQVSLRPEINKQRRIPEGIEEGDRGANALRHWEKNWFDNLPSSGKGKYVYQHHWVGLEEEESTKFNEAKLFSDTEHAPHGDLRFEADENLWGWTIFIGEAKDNARLPSNDKLIDWTRKGQETLRVQPKLAQPKEWLPIGVGEKYIGGPGEAGSRAETWSSFFSKSNGAYTVGYARRHAQEVFVTSGPLKGRMVFQLAPLGRENAWIVDRPEDQTPFVETNKLLPILKDIRSKRQEGLVWSDGKRPPVFIDAEDFSEVIEKLEEADPDIGDEWSIIQPFNKSPSKRKSNKAADSDGVMVCLPVPMEVARRIAVEDGEVPDQMHITLTYHGKNAEVDEETVKKIIEVTAHAATLSRAMPIKLSGTGRFSGDEDDPFVALVDSSVVHEFRDTLANMLRDESVYFATDHGFTPHVTIAYLDKNEPTPFERCQEEFSINQIQVVVGADRVTFPMGVTTTDYATSFAKADNERRYTFGVVYKATNRLNAPESDAHNEFVTAEDLQESLWEHVRREDRSVYIQHGLLQGVGFRKAGEWVEITTWPYEVQAEFKLPNQQVRKHTIPAGSAWMGVIWEPWAWELVKEGKIRGYSFGGTARRVTKAQLY